jgi:hypothetical protein
VSGLDLVAPSGKLRESHEAAPAPEYAGVDERVGYGFDRRAWRYANGPIGFVFECHGRKRDEVPGQRRKRCQDGEGDDNLETA